MSQNKIESIFNRYSYVFLSEGNNHPDGFTSVLSASDKIETDLSKLSLHDANWKFFIAQYDLKNKFENLHSKNKKYFNKENFGFFIPEFMQFDFRNDYILDYAPSNFKNIKWKSSIQCTISAEEYLNKVNQIKQHIQRGDIYELNFCISFEACVVGLDPLFLFYYLNSLSEAPFSGIYKWDTTYVICASPERFLKKVGQRIITQPIKGTSPRKKGYIEDELEKKKLLDSTKEKNENVMIVDVSRNDLSRIAARGTVEVEELFGIYSFKQVHQMISTVTCELSNSNVNSSDTNIGFGEILTATFPMASMTGAPKIKAMQLIDEFENFSREYYSGSMGYVDSNGNFDSNVIIRSIYYDTSTGKLSFAVGSAITALCNPEQEYEECLLKAKGILQLFEKLNPNL